MVVKTTYANDIKKFNKLCFAHKDDDDRVGMAIYHEATPEENLCCYDNYFTIEEDEDSDETTIIPHVNNYYNNRCHLMNLDPQTVMSYELSRHCYQHVDDKRDWRWAALLRKANSEESFEDLFYELDTSLGTIIKIDNSSLVDIKFDKDGYVYFKFNIVNGCRALPYYKFQFMKVNCLYNDVIYDAHVKSLGNKLKIR